MNVLNVNHLLDAETGGGTAERTFQLSRFFEKAGARCTILTLDIGITNARLNALEGPSVVQLHCINRRYFLPRVSFAFLKNLVAKANVVQLSGHWTVLNALVFLMCKFLRKPYVFCPAGALAPVGRSIFIKRLYDAVIGFRIARSAAMCIAITTQERADFLRYGVPPERVAVIANGIDPKQYELTEAAAIKGEFRQRHGLGDVPYVLFLGRLNSIKGPDLLLDAFADVASRFPGIHLVFAGPDGGMLSMLQEKVKQGAIAEKVHFIGYIDGVDKLAALQSASLLAIPSRREAMSIVVLEAGICATPTLFTNACGLDEIAQAGAGTMVPASVDGLSAGLFATLSDKVAASDAGERLKRIVLDHYTWEKQSALYLALFNHLPAENTH